MINLASSEGSEWVDLWNLLGLFLCLCYLQLRVVIYWCIHPNEVKELVRKNVVLKNVSLFGNLAHKAYIAFGPVSSSMQEMII